MMRWVFKRKPVKDEKCGDSVKEKSSAEPVKDEGSAEFVEYSVSIKDESSAEPVNYVIYVRPVKKEISAEPTKEVKSADIESSTEPASKDEKQSEKDEKQGEKGHIIWYIFGYIANGVALLSLFLLSACLYDTKISNPDNTVDVCKVLIISALLHLSVLIFFKAKHEFLKENSILWYLFLQYDCKVVITSSIPLYLKVLIYFFKDCVQLKIPALYNVLIIGSNAWMCVVICICASIKWSINVGKEASKVKSIEEISYAQFIVQVALSILTVVGVFISGSDVSASSGIIMKYGFVLSLYLLISHGFQLKIFALNKD